LASVEYSPRAIEDIQRLVDFLREADSAAADATADLIEEALILLARHPLIGHWASPRHRELVISRGRTGYIALYSYDARRDRVIVKAIRHQREAGFEE
jgi:addiction module RelE/StbE family toxin